MSKKFIAEVIGTFTLVFLGCATALFMAPEQGEAARLVAISLHLHTAGAAAEGFLARQIRDVLWRGRKFKVSSVATFVCVSSARSKSRTQLFPSIFRAMVPPCRDERRPSTPHHRPPTHRTAPRAFHPRHPPETHPASTTTRITRDEPRNETRTTKVSLNDA